MNQKGFTLVELLAVVIVIGLIAAFTLPQLVNQYSNETEELSEKQEELILETARAYVLENISSYPETSSSYCISIQSLIDAEALDLTITKQTLGDSYNSNYSIQASYQGTSVSVVLNRHAC